MYKKTEIIRGKFEFEYRGEQKSIEYSFDIRGYGGSPMLTLKNDKNHHFPFVRNSVTGWGSLINNLNWPADFMEILFALFEEKYNEENTRF